MSAFIDNKKNTQTAPRKLKGTDAADLITSLPHESLSVVGFNTMEAERLGLRQGDEIQVFPEDTGDISRALFSLLRQ